MIIRKRTMIIVILHDLLKYNDPTGSPYFQKPVKVICDIRGTNKEKEEI